jgi:hypothetical protein
MTKTVKVLTASGSREIPAVWVGAHLAVHRPLKSDTASGLSEQSRWWAVTHAPTGYSASGGIDATQREVISLAKQWDEAFSAVTAAGDAKTWKLRERWADDLRRIKTGKRVLGPREITPLERLESAGTYAEVSSAVRAAFGYTEATPDEAAEPFPAHETMAADRIRPGEDAWPDVFWRGKWWPVPTLSEVESWALDSLAETPDGRTVEPDHPEAWPRILGVI